VELLRSAGADVAIRFLNAGHGLTNGEIEIACDWLRTKLAPGESSKAQPKGEVTSRTEIPVQAEGVDRIRYSGKGDIRE
jgi:hypothetical protein